METSKKGIIYFICHTLAFTIDTIWKICTMTTIFVADLSMILFISRNVTQVSELGMRNLVIFSSISTIGLVIITAIAPLYLTDWVEKLFHRGKFAPTYHLKETD